MQDKAMVTMGASVAQRLGRRTFVLAITGLIPGPGIVRHLRQLSLQSLRGR